MAVNTSSFAVRFRKLRELLCEGRSHFEQAYNDSEFHVTIIYEMSLFIWDVCEWSQNRSLLHFRELLLEGRTMARHVSKTLRLEVRTPYTNTPININQ